VCLPISGPVFTLVFPSSREPSMIDRREHDQDPIPRYPRMAMTRELIVSTSDLPSVFIPFLPAVIFFWYL